MEPRAHKIDEIESGSIAQELGIEAGDWLLAINGQALQDVLDYHYLINDAHLTVSVRKQDGQEWEYDVEKDYYEDLGIVFYNGLMDDYRSCTNKCIFCFIDQMPPNMRETLYFKDDDSRLSFLQGNYITLTNMKQADIDRIIRYRLGPINISVHTTDPELRVKMLSNRFAGEKLDYIRQLAEAGIEMNGQIVLCRGINDGDQLDRTIRDLSAYLPHMQSVSVVPVGLTKYREGLYPLEPLTEEDARDVLDRIRYWQEKCYQEYGLHFIHASDEFYLLAGEPFPEEEVYDGYLQLENGVGMIPLLISEFEECLEEEKDQPQAKPQGFFSRIRHKKEHSRRQIVSIATGQLAAPLMRKLAMEYMTIIPDTDIRVYEIENQFFGPRITVSGLITGTDLAKQLRGKELGDRLLLPTSMMRSGEEVFLDDVKLKDLSNSLQVPIHIVKSSGRDLFDELKGIDS